MRRLRTSSATAMSMSPCADTMVTLPESLTSISMRYVGLLAEGGSGAPRWRCSSAVFYQRPSRAFGARRVERDLVDALVHEEESHAALGHGVEVRWPVATWVVGYALVFDVHDESVGKHFQVDRDGQSGLAAVGVLDDVVADLADGDQERRAGLERQLLADELRPEPRPHPAELLGLAGHLES